MDNYNKRAWEWVVKEKYGGILPKNKQIITTDLKRLKSGEPVDYIIGCCRFLGCQIDLSKKPLIPRPETEWWVEKAIEETKKRKIKRAQFLDIFSGSGCIGISLLKSINSCQVDFAEINSKFIKQIEINVALNKINKRRYLVVASDVFSNIEKKYDAIFANPPYIPKTRLEELPLSVKKFEPHKALFSGADGLMAIKRFLKEAKNHLKVSGIIYLEFDSLQKKPIEVILKKYKYSNWRFEYDQYNHWRYVKICL